MHYTTLLKRCIYVLKVKFSVTYDVVFTVDVPYSEMNKLCVTDAKLCYFF